MNNKIQSGSKVIVLSSNRKGVVRAILSYPNGKAFAEVHENSNKKYVFYDVNELDLDMDIGISDPII